jgi:hypothetical protein
VEHTQRHPALRRRVQKISITLVVLEEFLVISVFHKTKIPTVDKSSRCTLNLTKIKFGKK